LIETKFINDKCFHMSSGSNPDLADAVELAVREELVHIVHVVEEVLLLLYYSQA